MHKIDVDSGTKTLIEVKDLKDFAFDGLVAKGNAYQGVCSDNGVRVKTIKGRCIQNISGGGVSPDNPVEIETVRIKKVASFGKNFGLKILDNGIVKQRCTVTESGGFFTMSTTGADAYWGEVRATGQPRTGSEGTLFVAPAGKVYCKSMNNVFDKMFIQMWDKDLKSLGYLISFSSGRELNPATKYISLRVGIENSQAGTTYTDQIMISTEPITDWEPPYYEEVNVDLELFSLPSGVCDEVKDGKLIRRVKKLVLDGSNDELYSIQNTPNPYFGYNDTSRTIKPRKDGSGAIVSNVFCNRLQAATPDYLWAGLTANGVSIDINPASIVRVRVEGVTAVDELRAWLQSNPLTIYCELETPIITPLADIIVPTKAPYTIVTHDSPVETEIEYEILTKSDYLPDIIDIKKRLAALEAAAVGGGN
ncbi:hypothetical protein [uncultured Dubosiella sp.]|uniref:hypothetical protein n=1 Tax=uncultured Dubosiella sp. TaxID=1937011 RepID=UPI00259436B4|nr:hypothetical protein [uncultured Dubosiella sp.]